MLLGGNRPVQSHSSSQPFSSLYLAVQTRTQCQRNRHQLLGVMLNLGHKVHVCFKGLLDMVVGQLFEDLTEDLVLERLGLQCSFKDLICELVDRTHPFGRVVTHVLHHTCR